MQIVCPSCAAEYRLDPERIGPEGRMVRCASCREAWFVAAPGQEQDTLSPPGEAVFTAVDAPVPVPARPKAPAARTARPSLAALAVCLGLALAGAALLARERVVRALPQTARLYAAIGLPVNLRGLDFRDVVAFQVPAGAGSEGRLVVEGDLVSAAAEPRPVPPLALEVRDEADQLVYSWTAEAPRARLEPKDAARFRAELAAPPARGRRVLVRFAAVDTEKSPVSVGSTPSPQNEAR
ncbi:DUF3426 domain-containing protein [Methylobacterium nodulans]|uniref:MJ0042 family finger-like protein n=1 Tax=Methylobacterium nodulans (strain LMG 21967 / CNCM I-2342 / ORS 2060) TaxID=460265 RepID=B8IJE6_METNO|nr:DUF3426 domain-containing protein [Methylobacterium nodulans]ACL56161.1 MJ0042 family finger-like protein [Methylobacterium nodulans ORS 2060]